MASGQRFEWERELLARDYDSTKHKRSTVILIGLALATHFNARSLSAYPSVKTLAEEAGSKPNTVRSVLSLLEKIGMLSVERRGLGAGAHNTNRYHFLVAGARNSPAGDHSSLKETTSQSPIHQSANGLPDTPKQPPTVIETGPPGTPNSNEQQENSAAPINTSHDELKHQYPEEWAQARGEVDHRIARGHSIENPDRYAVPIFEEFVRARQENHREAATNERYAAAKAECNRCESDGFYWQDQDGQYNEARIKCDHKHTAHPPTDRTNKQTMLRKENGTEYAAARSNEGPHKDCTDQSTAQEIATKNIVQIL